MKTCATIWYSFIHPFLYATSVIPQPSTPAGRTALSQHLRQRELASSHKFASQNRSCRPEASSLQGHTCHRWSSSAAACLTQAYYSVAINHKTLTMHLPTLLSHFYRGKWSQHQKLDQCPPWTITARDLFCTVSIKLDISKSAQPPYTTELHPHTLEVSLASLACQSLPA